MSETFQRVAIVGVGLLGASLGLALKARGLVKTVAGAGRRRETLEKALALGAIDLVADSPEEAADGADLAVIATPAAAVLSAMDALRGLAESGSLVVTDVASTKAVICAHAVRTWKAPRQFVGSHPMAGSEKSGPEYGTADLYEGAVCLIEDSPGTDPEAVQLVRRLWGSVGARLVALDPESHDRMLARTSHLPHVAAAALAALAAEVGARREVIGRGFLDSTRIADGPPEVWRDICLTNREAVLESVAGLKGRLERFEALLRAGDGHGLEAYFEEGRRGRRGTAGK